MRVIAYRPFAKELQDLTTSDLSEITGRPIPESHFVEYKSQFEKPALIKAVAAFANSDGGGTVLLGVEEHNLVPTAVPGIDITSSLPEQIAQTITSNITPVPDFRLALVPATDPNKVVAIIEVFPGTYPPYMLTSNGLIYVRGEVGSEPVSLRDRAALDRLFHQAERGAVWARGQLERLLNRSGNKREAFIWTVPTVEEGLQEHETIFRESLQLELGTRSHGSGQTPPPKRIPMPFTLPGTDPTQSPTPVRALSRPRGKSRPFGKWMTGTRSTSG
jgi:hypothetical protein